MVAAQTLLSPSLQKEILLLNLVDYHTEKYSITNDRILIAWVKKELLIAIDS